MRYLWLVFLSIPAVGQVTTGSISGYVIDPANRPIPQSSVTAADASRSIRKSAMTDASGFYRFEDLPPSVYELSTTAKGFEPVKIANVRLKVNENLRADFRPQVAGKQETVTVRAAVRDVQTESSELGTVLESGTISELPLNARDFLQLALLTPGVLPPVQDSALSTRGDFAMHANGGREEFNNYLLDGVDNNDQDTNRYVMQPSVDAIQEFKIATNSYSAQYGRNAGGQVNVITRSGTNEFHGFLYDYLRNRDVDARNFFDGSDKPQLIRNQFGGGMGGPLIANRTFFFADYDGLRGEQGYSRLATVPTAAERSGDLAGSTPVMDPFSGAPFPGNQIPASLISPIAQKILSLYPLPTNNSVGGNYLAQPVENDRLDQFNIRLDHRLSDREQLTLRYSYFYKNIFEPYAEDSQSLPGFGDFPQDRGHNALINYVRTLSPSTINSLLLGFNRAARSDLQQNYKTNVNSLWGVNYLPTDPIQFGYPSIDVLGLSLAGDVTTLPIDRHTTTYQLNDTLSLVRGNHGIQIGAEFRKIELNGIVDVYARGESGIPGRDHRIGYRRLTLRSADLYPLLPIDGAPDAADLRFQFLYTRRLEGPAESDSELRIALRIQYAAHRPYQSHGCPEPVHGAIEPGGNRRHIALRHPAGLYQFRSARGLCLESAKEFRDPRRLWSLLRRRDAGGQFRAVL